MICGVAALMASFQTCLWNLLFDGNFHATFYDVPIEDKDVILNNANTENGMLSREEGIANQRMWLILIDPIFR